MNSVHLVGGVCYSAPTSFSSSSDVLSAPQSSQLSHSVQPEQFSQSLQFLQSSQCLQSLQFMQFMQFMQFLQFMQSAQFLQFSQLVQLMLPFLSATGLMLAEAEAFLFFMAFSPLGWWA